MIVGKQVTTPRIDLVQPGTAAAAAGFKKGDVIVAVDGKSIDSFSDVERIIATHPSQPLEFTIDRGQQRLAVTATPELRNERDPFNNVHRIGRLDIGGPMIRPRVATIQPGSAAAQAGLELGDLIVAINDKPVETFVEVRNIVVEHPGKPLKLTVQRNGRTTSLTTTPKAQNEKAADGSVRSIGVLGISGNL